MSMRQHAAALVHSAATGRAALHNLKGQNEKTQAALALMAGLAAGGAMAQTQVTVSGLVDLYTGSMKNGGDTGRKGADGSYAYRVRAKLDAPTAHRVGLKGTARLSGHWVPLVYWAVRRPLAFIRQTLGW